jgi:hypothetical protein
VIRAVLKRPGSPDLVVLGIDARNVDRLRDGKPIHVVGEPLGVPFDVAVLYGDTLHDVAAEFERAGVPLPPDVDLDPPAPE